ncbi:MAG: holin [Clostridiales bacterium]|nr:holin [Clostridiales bacterium]
MKLTDDQKEKLKAAGKRAAWTVAQAAIAAIGTATVMSEVDWKMVVSASALAGILSLLKSVTIGMPEVD